jgi:predicted phage terminase large subunit-like protein
MHLQRDYRPAIVAELSQHRRTLAEESPQTFAKTYLSHHLTKPMSRMHEELFELLKQASVQRPKRIATAAPRGHAKTTVVSLAYVLWCALYRKEMLILMISATKDQAVGLMKNIKHELQANRRLLEDFPEVAYPPGSRPAPKPWRDNQIVLRNGVAIRTLGANQGIRGMKHGQHRPSLIIVDDLEDQEQVQSAEQRDKLRDWFEKTLLKAGEPMTNVIIVGTILHYDSLLACILLPPTSANPRKISGWETRKYQAVESWSESPQLWEKWELIYTGQEQFNGQSGPDAAIFFYKANVVDMFRGTRVLWPELERYYDLMVTRVREGRISFQSEKQNEPVDPKACIFREESFRYWDKDFRSPSELVTAMDRHGSVFGACDPSLGKRGGAGDYSAILTIVEDSRDKTLYVVDADIAHRRPDQIIDRILELARIYRYDNFVVESNQFQELLVQQLEDRARSARIALPVEAITSSTHKQQRIEALEPLVSQGVLRFSLRQQLLLEQLRQYPLGAHDDGPDALHMAVEAARHPPCGFTVQVY